MRCYTQGFAYLRFHFLKVGTTSRGAGPAVKIRQKAATDEPIIHSSKWTRFSFFSQRKEILTLQVSQHTNQRNFPLE